MALLATMLVRYRRFRHILIFERRGWRDRLILRSPSAFPSRPAPPSRRPAALRRGGPDARRRLSGRADRGAIRRSHRRSRGCAARALRRRIHRPAVRGRMRVRRRRIARAVSEGGIWHFSPFVFSSLPRRLWQLFRRFEIDWQVVLLLAPVALELLRQAPRSSLRRAPPVLPCAHDALLLGLIVLATVLCGRGPDQDLEQRTHRAPPPGAGEAADGGASRRWPARSTRISSSTRSPRSRRSSDHSRRPREW